MLIFTHAAVWGLLQNLATTPSTLHNPQDGRLAIAGTVVSPKILLESWGLFNIPVSPLRPSLPPASHQAIRGVNAVPSPYQLPTCAASSSDFPMKSEDALEEVGGW